MSCDTVGVSTTKCSFNDVPESPKPTPPPGEDRPGYYNGRVRIITTHLSADFDAFAAAVCAVRLYPDHGILFPGSQEAAVRRFLEDTGLPFPEIKLRQARREKLEHAVVTDTRNPARLGEVWELIQRDRCPITVIDHHTTEENLVGARELVSQPVGATCTIVADLMKERGLPPTPEEASLLLMGIYEDTGGLSYRETSPIDLRIVAWLLEQGGSLDWVRRWVMKALQPDQLELLNRIVAASEEIRVHDVPVVLSAVEVDRYHEEAAFVVHRWVETFEIPVGVAMLVRPPHVNLIFRSRVSGLHAGRVAQHFGGGGHPTAASARVSGLMPVEVRERLLRVLDQEMPPPSAAIDVAVRKIFSIDLDISVADTKDRLNELRVNALPVRDPETGGLVGQVTRQILDRGLSHGMGNRPVETVMQPEVPTVEARTPLSTLGDLFLERSYRFVVVEQDGEPVGIVTRMELFRRLFERQHATGSVLDNRMAGARPVSQPVTRMLRSVPEWVKNVLAAARQVADEQGLQAFLVGGIVRDLLLDRANEDVDLVVEGDGIAFAEALAQTLGGRSHPHAPFLTAVVTLPDGHRADVASARTEFYRTPAALPEVETSLIRQDLYRRDFTINSLAICLTGDRYGQLVDFFGGRKDLQKQEIRVLHSLSFIDDPTRAIRAVRYARRLGFAIAGDTRNLISTAVSEGVFNRLTGQRLRRELEHLLAEPHPTPSLALLAELDLLTAISPDIRWSEDIRSHLLELEGQLAWYQLEELGPLPEPWLLFLGALILRADGRTATGQLADRLQLVGDLRERMLDLPRAVNEIHRVAADPSLPLSARLRCIEGHHTEAVLITMASVEMTSRRRLAAAVDASARILVPVTGAQLIAEGIPPGPHVGSALASTRDALADGAITADDALNHALAAARLGAGTMETK